MDVLLFLSNAAYDVDNSHYYLHFKIYGDILVGGKRVETNCSTPLCKPPPFKNFGKQYRHVLPFCEY